MQFVEIEFHDIKFDCLNRNIYEKAQLQYIDVFGAGSSKMFEMHSPAGSVRMLPIRVYASLF